MADSVSQSQHIIRPLGSQQDDVREIVEQTNFAIRTYQRDAYGEVAESYRPKNADEADRLWRGLGEIKNRRAVTLTGLGVIALVTIASILTFLGITNSFAESAHEDAVRLLILIVGAALGAVFGAELSKDSDKEKS